MGAKQGKRIQIFLANQPRLLREMLELALSQLLKNVEIRQIDARQVSSIDIAAVKSVLEADSETESKAGSVASRDNHNQRTQNEAFAADSKSVPWIMLTVHTDDAQSDAGPNEQTVALLSQHPYLQIALLGNDARTLETYIHRSAGNIEHKTYRDFSLAQFIDVFGQAA